VQVLDHEQDGALVAERLEQRQQGLEDARLEGVLAGRPVPEAGEHVRERRPQRVGERVEGGMLVAYERSQRRHQRRVGELALAELDAVAGEHEGSRLARPPDELLDQARLPHARLAGYQRQRGAPISRVVKRGLQLGELAGSPDEAGACHAGGHRRMTILPPRGPGGGSRS
jgi:hypothetical protein